MRIWRFHEFGDLANLTLEEIPTPEPVEGEALIELDYAALNPADALLVKGRYPGPGETPLAVGRDGCGTIVESRGGGFEKGDRVVLLRVEPEEAARRLGGGQADRIESRGLDYFRRVVEGYDAMAAAEPGRFVVVDGAGDVDDVARAVREGLDDVL